MKAHEGLVFAVNVLMVTEVILPPKGFVAREGQLICMGSLLDHKVVAIGKLPLAILADVAYLG